MGKEAPTKRGDLSPKPETAAAKTAREKKEATKLAEEKQFEMRLETGAKKQPTKAKTKWVKDAREKREMKLQAERARAARSKKGLDAMLAEDAWTTDWTQAELEAENNFKVMLHRKILDPVM